MSRVAGSSYQVEEISELSKRVDELWKVVMMLASELSRVNAIHEDCKKEIVKLGYILSDLAEEIAILKAHVKIQEE